MIRPTRLVVVKTLLRKSPSGSTGSAARLSARTKPTRETAPITARPDDLRRSPGVGIAPERGQEHDRAQAGGQQACPEVVDRVAHALGDRRQRHRENDERRDPERDVDEEDPAPREMGREEAADQRAGDAGEAEHRAEDALIAPTVARRDDVSDRRLRRHHQTAAPEPLHRSERDQLGQVLRDPAQDRADQEHHQPDLEHDLAAVLIAELPVQRRHDRLREQVRRHDPADVVEPSRALPRSSAARSKRSCCPVPPAASPARGRKRRRRCGANPVRPAARDPLSRLRGTTRTSVESKLAGRQRLRCRREPRLLARCAR